MEKNITIQTPFEYTATVPGPLFPDRCLDCPELLEEGYGCVRRSRCSDCLTTSLRRKKAPAFSQ